MLLNLSSASIKAIPESLVSAWKTWERQNRLRVLANWSVTIRVLRLLDSAGIRAVPIKGVALSQQLYGSPWLRPAGDVDVLIERRMISAAHAAMLGAGFAAKELFSNLSASQWQWLLNNGHEACYRDRQAGLLVELQWRMHGNALLNNLDESWVRGDPKVIEVIGHKVPALPELVLYLLVMSHLACSRWCRLIWVLDSWKALQSARTVHTEADLEAIIAKHGATRIHRQFLKLMQHLLEDKRLSQWSPPGFCPPHERRGPGARCGKVGTGCVSSWG